MWSGTGSGWPVVECLNAAWGATRVAHGLGRARGSGSRAGMLLRNGHPSLPARRLGKLPMDLLDMAARTPDPVTLPYLIVDLPPQTPLISEGTSCRYA